MWDFKRNTQMLWSHLEVYNPKKMNNEMPSVEVVDVLTKSTIRVNTMLFVDIFRQFFFWRGLLLQRRREILL